MDSSDNQNLSSTGTTRPSPGTSPGLEKDKLHNPDSDYARSGGIGADWRAMEGDESMKDWITVLKAADAAARWHVHQRRKGAAKEPYINHLLEVATLVAEATEGKDPNLVIAALLHDAIEDCEVPPELIADTFGTDVADLVAEVTEDKSLSKAERRKFQA